jgi:hypothetical protein
LPILSENKKPITTKYQVLYEARTEKMSNILQLELEKFDSIL